MGPTCGYIMQGWYVRQAGCQMALIFAPCHRIFLQMANFHTCVSDAHADAHAQKGTFYHGVTTTIFHPSVEQHLILASYILTL